MKRASLILVLVLAAAGAVRADSSSDGLTPADRAKIERLIAVVETLPDASFIRNGKAYGPATAGKFLRGKWKDREASIRSVDDFIQNVATRSSTTGQPYLIRFNDGREIATAEFFRSELAKLK
jgi:membrane-bound lytic murein transglycosylase